MAATTVQTAIAELDTEKVPTTRLVSAGAGMSGNGDLTADRSRDASIAGTGTFTALVNPDGLSIN